VAAEILNIHSNILCDLPQKKRRNIPARMKRNRRATTVRMTILLVRTALADLDETKVFKNAGNFARFEHRNISHKVKP